MCEWSTVSVWCDSRFTEALPSQPVGHLLWRRVVVEWDGRLGGAMDDQRLVQVGLPIGQPLEELVIHHHGCQDPRKGKNYVVMQ